MDEPIMNITKKLITKNSTLKRLNNLALPILLTYLMGFIFTIGDQAIVGRTSLEGYTGVTTVSNILYYLTGTLGIIGLTLNIHGSRLLGEKKYEDYSKLFNTAFSISIALGILFFGVSNIFGRVFLIDFFDMTPSVADVSMQYLRIASLGLGLNMLIFVFSSYFKSSELPKVLVYSSMISNVVNLTVDYSLVFGKFGFPEMGVAGAAIGTIAGLAVSLVIYICYFIHTGKFKLRLYYNGPVLKQIGKSYVPLVCQDFLESTVFVLVITAIISSLGVVQLGAYGLMNIIVNMLLLPVYAYGNATMTIVSKSKGSGEYAIIRDVLKIACSILAFITFCSFAVLSWDSGLVFSLITPEKELHLAASGIILVVCIAQLFNVPHMILKYTLNGLSFEGWIFKFTSVVTVLVLSLLWIMNTYRTLSLKSIFILIAVNYLILSVGYYIKLGNVLRSVSSEINNIEIEEQSA